MADGKKKLYIIAGCNGAGKTTASLSILPEVLDCQEFVKKVNDAALRQFGGAAILPTEAEWEYACRAGATTANCWGNALNGDKANCDGNNPCGTTARGPYKGWTVTVGSYQPNAWGFCDMHGNVWEWCQDWYDKFNTGSLKNPTGPSSPYDIMTFHIHRGGSYFSEAYCCRLSFRDNFWPDGVLENLGFRLAL